VLSAGVGLLLGLNRPPSADSGFDGDAEALGVAAGVADAFCLDRRSLGEAAGDPMLLAGEAEALAGVGDATAFLWLRFAGDADDAGDALGEGD